MLKENHLNNLVSIFDYRDAMKYSYNPIYCSGYSDKSCYLNYIQIKPNHKFHYKKYLKKMEYLVENANKIIKEYNKKEIYDTKWMRDDHFNLIFQLGMSCLG